MKNNKKVVNPVVTFALATCLLPLGNVYANEDKVKENKGVGQIAKACNIKPKDIKSIQRKANKAAKNLIKSVKKDKRTKKEKVGNLGKCISEANKSVRTEIKEIKKAFKTDFKAAKKDLKELKSSIKSCEDDACKEIASTQLAEASEAIKLALNEMKEKVKAVKELTAGKVEECKESIPDKFDKKDDIDKDIEPKADVSTVTVDDTDADSSKISDCLKGVIVSGKEKLDSINEEYSTNSKAIKDAIKELLSSSKECKGDKVCRDDIKDNFSVLKDELKDLISVRKEQFDSLKDERKVMFKECKEAFKEDKAKEDKEDKVKEDDDSKDSDDDSDKDLDDDVATDKSLNKAENMIDSLPDCESLEVE